MNNEARPVAYSKTTITELMIPSYANFGGKIHGGIILSLMDKVAYACAAKHAGSYCVTVAVEGVEFLEPIHVGELVSLKASVNHVGNSSLVIGIRVTTENINTAEVKHTNTSYFTMVAKNTENEPRLVPELILQNDDEIRRFMEAIIRKELKATYRKELNNEHMQLKVKDYPELLQGQRCRVEKI